MRAHTHAHATHGACRTLCGLDCAKVPTLYGDDKRNATCPTCQTYTTTTRKATT